MRISSRRILPPSDPPMTLGCWLFLAALMGGLGATIYFQPWIIVVFLVIIAVSMVAEAGACRRLRSLAEGRPGESICTFARSFDFRATDTRIIRATHEELHPYYRDLCPIRASDRLTEEVGVDEDLDEIVFEITRRAGRSLDRVEDNPFSGRLTTVADLVHFLAHQPTQVTS